MLEENDIVLVSFNNKIIGYAESIQYDQQRDLIGYDSIELKPYYTPWTCTVSMKEVHFHSIFKEVIASGTFNIKINKLYSICPSQSGWCIISRSKKEIIDLSDPSYLFSTNKVFRSSAKQYFENSRVADIYYKYKELRVYSSDSNQRE